MPYNRDIHAEAPLPSGGLPTDDEVMAMIGRGRRLQSQAFWRTVRKLFVAEPPAGAAMPLGIRRKPIWRMLDRLGFDVDALKAENYAPVMGMLSRRCGECRNGDKCREWLDARRVDNSYRRFCLNAPLFGVLPRRG